MEFRLEIDDDELQELHEQLSNSCENGTAYDHILNLEGILSDYFSNFRIG